MRHQVDGRKLGRNTSHRKALFRNMANAVIQKERIVTTTPKAKEVRRVVDRLITLGKKGTPAHRRLAFDRTRDSWVVKRLFSELAERYKARPGGYTRIVKLSDLRRGDAADLSVLELVDHPPIDRKRKKPASEGEGETKGKKAAEAAPATGGDPIKKIGKLFGGKKKEAKAKKSAKPTQPQAKAKASTAKKQSSRGA